MKKVHFTILPYRASDNEINPNWIYLALVTTDNEIVVKQDINKDAWKNNVNECQAYWKHALLTSVEGRLLRESENRGYVYNREHRLLIDDEIYDDWYRWYYYIDDEDAYEYISRCGHSQHTLNWQSRCGVLIGWKYYKILKQHNFLESTAAMLAYVRGYLAGMESNSRWNSEGMEALGCLGLDIEGGSDALCI